MSIFVVDSSTIISCAMNCLMWVFDELHEAGVKFVVPQGVRKEVVESGLRSKKYKYEAIRVLESFSKGTFQVYSGDLKKKTSKMLNYANTSIRIRNKNMKILQKADAEVAVLGKIIDADGVITDERTLRLLIEDPSSIREAMEHKFHSNVKVNKKSIKAFNKEVGNIEVVRSVDLIAFAFSKGVFNKMLTTCYSTEKKTNCKKEMLEGLLYSLKFSGCAVSMKEINDYVNILT